MITALLFWLFAAVAVGSGLVVITQRNPFVSALGLVVTFFCLAGVYVLLDATFIAVIQVLLYAGAIMVLFLFVIMLLNLRGDENLDAWRLTPRSAVGIMAAVVLGGAGVLAAGIQASQHGAPAAVGEWYGTAEAVGITLFGGGWLLPLEVISLLLTVALVGAVVLARREL